MSQPMPISGFGWMSADESENIDLLTQPEVEPEGYFNDASMH